MSLLCISHLNFAIIIALADGLALSNAKPSKGTVVIKFAFHTCVKTLESKVITKKYHIKLLKWKIKTLFKQDNNEKGLFSLHQIV